MHLLQVQTYSSPWDLLLIGLISVHIFLTNRFWVRDIEPLYYNQVKTLRKMQSHPYLKVAYASRERGT